MNTNAIAKHYDKLTPAERFPLILAAGARGDEVEADRLVNAGGRITLSMPDHSPFARAFGELAWLTLIELLDAAADYLEALARADSADLFADNKRGTKPRGRRKERTERGENGRPDKPLWVRFLEIAYAAGFLLKTKVDGWKLFCERRNFPPFVLWDELPAFDRLQRALGLAGDAAFKPDGMLNWLNSTRRPGGMPEATQENLISADKWANDAERIFRMRVEWWGG